MSAAPKSRVFMGGVPCESEASGRDGAAGTASAGWRDGTKGSLGEAWIIEPTSIEMQVRRATLHGATGEHFTSRPSVAAMGKLA